MRWFDSVRGDCPGVRTGPTPGPLAALADPPQPLTIELEVTLAEPAPAARGNAVRLDVSGSYRTSGLVTGIFSVPLGADTLQYRGDHVEDPWHGGGWVHDPGSPNADVLDVELLSWATSPVDQRLSLRALAATQRLHLGRRKALRNAKTPEMRGLCTWVEPDIAQTRSSSPLIHSG